MPLDGITLRFAVQELQCLVGGRIDRATQPEKDMAVLLIRNENRNTKLLLSASPAMARFHITDESFTNPDQAPMFCMLLRKYLIGGRIVSIEQPYGDRAVCITINNRDELGESGPCELWLELMGRHSNLTLVKNGKIIDSIRHVSSDMSRVRHMLPGLEFVRPPRQDKLTLEELEPEKLQDRLKNEHGNLSSALLRHITGLSPVSAQEWALRVTGLKEASVDSVDIGTVSEKLCDFSRKLMDLKAPQLLVDASGRRLDFFPFTYLSYPMEMQKPCPSVQEAMSRFYSVRDRNERMQQKSASLKRLVKTMIERDEKKLMLLEDALRDAADADRYRLYGELLSAQMHLVSKGSREVRLQNFYDADNQTILIPLDETLSPVQNAQKYFKRYRKAMASRKTSSEQKALCLQELQILEETAFELERCEMPEDLNDIRKILEAQGILKPDKASKKKKQPVSTPLRFKSRDGFSILAGKNGLQNERITKEADGDDMWLHAKDMPGSHVIICLNKKPVTQDALMDAARIAAWYSKSRGLSVPVDYTYRRYVKKPGGTPTGFVTFTHNKTLLISTTEAEIRELVLQ